MGVRKNMKKLVGRRRQEHMIEDSPEDTDNAKQHTIRSQNLRSSRLNTDVDLSERSLQSNQIAADANMVIRSQPTSGYRSSLAVLQATQDNPRNSYAVHASMHPYGYALRNLSSRIPSNETIREIMYEGSLRQSRPPSIYGNSQLPPTPRRPQPVSYTSYVSRNNRISNAMRPMNKDERVFEDAKQEIWQLKIQDVESTRNTLQLAYQAFQIGAKTLDMLGEQTDRLRNAERRLDQTGRENATATRKIRDLRAASRLINRFNPFISVEREQKDRQQKDNADITSARQQHYQDRDAVRLKAWHAWKQKEARFFVSVPLSSGATRSDLEARRKYQLEPDSEDELLEDEIEDNLEETLYVVRGARAVATAQGEEIEWQNRGIMRMNSKVDEVGRGVAVNRGTLNRMH